MELTHWPLIKINCLKSPANQTITTNNQNKFHRLIKIESGNYSEGENEHFIKKFENNF